jgi:hypothetical protein
MYKLLLKQKNLVKEKFFTNHQTNRFGLETRAFTNQTQCRLARLPFPEPLNVVSNSNQYDTWLP